MLGGRAVEDRLEQRVELSEQQVDKVLQMQLLI